MVKSGGSELKKICGNIGSSMKMAASYSRSYFLYQTANALLGAGATVAGVVFPAAIIRCLYPEPIMESAIAYVLAWAVLQFFFNISQNGIGKLAGIEEKRINAGIMSRLNRGVSGIRYEEAEQSETLDRIAFARKSVERSSMARLISSFSAIMASFLSIAGLISVVSRLSVFLFLLSLFIMLVRYKATDKIVGLRYRAYEEKAGKERLLYHTIWYLPDVPNGKELRLYGLLDYVTGKFNQARKEIYKMDDRLVMKMAKAMILPTVMQGIQYLAIYGWMTFSLYKGEISVSDFTLYTAAILQFGNLLSGIAENLANIRGESQYIESYIDLLGGESGVLDIQKRPEENAGFTLEYQHVWYRYPGREEYALQDINVSIKPGDKISIVGLNGSGKTTFIKLAMGLYKPVKGSILVNGRDMEDIPQDERLRMFAPVFQDYFLTAYSVRENIAFTETADNETIEHAMEEAGIRKAVEAMPGGAECMVTRRFDSKGCELSGGEQQKLAIARAIYKNASMLILDEPTAALSPQAEYDIYRKLNQIAENKSVLFISHRLASCRFCDDILVFEEGKLREKGTHEALMGKDGLYRRLFTVQASYYEEEGGRDETEDI